MRSNTDFEYLNVLAIKSILPKKTVKELVDAAQTNELIDDLQYLAVTAAHLYRCARPCAARQVRGLTQSVLLSGYEKYWDGVGPKNGLLHAKPLMYAEVARYVTQLCAWDTHAQTQPICGVAFQFNDDTRRLQGLAVEVWMALDWAIPSLLDGDGYAAMHDIAAAGRSLASALLVADRLQALVVGHLGAS